MLLWSPCKNLKPYDNPFWDLNNGGKKEERLITKENPLVPMGVLAPGSAHARPSAQPPIDTSGNFSAHMSGGGKLSDSFSDQLSRQIRAF